MPRDDTENMKKALTILEGQQETPEKILALAKDLKKEKRFGLGRKLLNRALQDSEIENNKNLKLEIEQQFALCTYKDPDLPMGERLERALKILGETDDLHLARLGVDLDLADRGAEAERR